MTSARTSGGERTGAAPTAGPVGPADATHAAGDDGHAASSGLRPGVLIAGRFRVEKRLGAGAMGEVWRARHETLHTDVAIKLATHDPARDAEHEERFRFEAQLSAQLGRHTDHIVSVHDAGRHEGVPFLVMEYVDGQTLDRLIEAEGPLPLERVAEVVEQVAEALSVAHAHAIWHRDVKGSNVLVVRTTTGAWLAKLADFGVAKSLGGRLELDTPKTTRAGVLVGTPAFMSPEQIAGDPPSAAGDLWSLAVTAFEAVTGELPFDGASSSALMHAIMTRPPRRASSVVPVPAALDAWFDKALHRDPTQRFVDAAELAARFRAAAVGVERRAHAATRWPAVALFGVGVLGVIALAVARADGPTEPSAARTSPAPMTPEPPTLSHRVVAEAAPSAEPEPDVPPTSSSDPGRAPLPPRPLAPPSTAGAQLAPPSASTASVTPTSTPSVQPKQYDEDETQ